MRKAISQQVSVAEQPRHCDFHHKDTKNTKLGKLRLLPITPSMTDGWGVRAVDTGPVGPGRPRIRMEP